MAKKNDEQIEEIKELLDNLDIEDLEYLIGYCRDLIDVREIDKN